MVLTMTGSRFNFRPGAPCFIVASNYCDEFELGSRSGDSHWLLAEMIGPPVEFLFNGRIFVPGISDAGTLMDNFPKGPIPKGWIKRPRLDSSGFELCDPDSGAVLFGYAVTQNVCRVTTSLYDGHGGLVAETSGGDFIIHQPPCRIGRGGIVIE